MYRRFWFEFEPIGRPTALNLGYGVTAYNHADAVALLKDFVFPTEQTLKIVRVVEDVKIDDLEKNHVLPNLGRTYERGIWFPQGYTFPRHHCGNWLSERRSGRSRSGWDDYER